jgi:GTP-binding protein Era
MSTERAPGIAAPRIAAPTHRAGAIALLGRPNAGKSTLLNALLGQKLAIVTAKPQTTRSRILGVLSLPHAQLMLLDTPGLHDAARALNRALNAIAEEAASDCDVALILVDPRTGWDATHAALREGLAAKRTPTLVVATKSDRGGAPLPEADLSISAETGAGLDELVARLVGLLPESPPHFDSEQITDRTLRFLAAEEIREALFEELEEELPYSTAVEIESFDESLPDGVRIRATLWVERDSQKGIVLGQGGRKIKAIGTRARAAIAKLLGGPAHLSLWVKVDPKWAKKPKKLAALGYR